MNYLTCISLSHTHTHTGPGKFTELVTQVKKKNGNVEDDEEAAAG